MLRDNSEELEVDDRQLHGFTFRAVCHRIVPLPDHYYCSFISVLTAQSFLMCQWIGGLLDPFNRKYFANLLLTVIIPHADLLVAFVKSLLLDQLKRESGKRNFSARKNRELR